MLKNLCLAVSFAALLPNMLNSQTCTPSGDQVSYGTGNTWIGYVYNYLGFVGYMGYVNVGSTSDASFETDFGGPYGTIATNGCPVDAEGFSIRFKLQKNFLPGYYELLAAGDDRVRLSIDGGNTWLINNWVFNDFNSSAAAVYLSGTYQLVLEYEEGAHNNKVYFGIRDLCTPAPTDLSVYGTSNQWRGYVYSGSTFSSYKGWVMEGTPGSLNFTQGFGGSKIWYSTSDCQIETEFFSVRYLLKQNFPFGSYSFTVSGDDKYRLSLDGGSTWVIDRWNYNTGNTSRVYTANLNGVYNLVLEYYEKDGPNSIGISSVSNVILASKLLAFSGSRNAESCNLRWLMAQGDEIDHFEIERSWDGVNFQAIKILSAIPQQLDYFYQDRAPGAGMKLFYRLKMVDVSGDFSYSRVIAIDPDISGIKIYPTFDIGSSINITNDVALSYAELELKDFAGKTVENIKLNLLSAGQTTQVSLLHSSVLHGWYILQLIAAGEVRKTEKIYFR